MNRIVLPSGDTGRSGGSNRGSHEDQDTFIGARPSSNIRKLLAHTNQGVARKCLQLAIDAAHHKDVPCLVDIAAEFDISYEEVQTLLAGAHDLVLAILRIPLARRKPKMFSRDLDVLQVSPELRKIMTELAFQNRPQELEYTTLPSLQELRWRVDVAISTSTIKRALKPSILMQMKLSNDRIYTFEVPVDKFHTLRYNTALALKELLDVNEKPTVQAASGTAGASTGKE